MKKEAQISTLVWRNISIEITYISDYSEATKKFLKYTLAHLGITSKDRVPLPITETGYRSRFEPAANIEAYGTPNAYVSAWLDEAAKSRKWKNRSTTSGQLSLF